MVFTSIVCRWYGSAHNSRNLLCSVVSELVNFQEFYLEIKLIPVDRFFSRQSVRREMQPRGVIILLIRGHVVALNVPLEFGRGDFPVSALVISYDAR